MRRVKRAPDLVDEFNVDFMCEGLNITPAEARAAIREGIEAGLLRIEATADEVRLVGTFPDELTP